MSKADRIKQRRLDRMRLGQAVCDYVTLPSDSEIRIAIVPLTEAEYMQAIQAVADLPAPENLAGMQLRDRKQAQEIVVRAIREDDDLTRRVYSEVNEMMEDLDVVDVDEIIDAYNEMVAQASPQADAITEEEIEEVKKVLQAMDWSVLSGRSWYALKRFLSTLTPMQQPDKSLGSGSTSLLTTTSE